MQEKRVQEDQHVYLKNSLSLHSPQKWPKWFVLHLVHGLYGPKLMPLTILLGVITRLTYIYKLETSSTPKLAVYITRITWGKPQISRYPKIFGMAVSKVQS